MDEMEEPPTTTFTPLAPRWFVVIDGAVGVLVAAALSATVGRRLRRVLPFLTPVVVRALLIFTVLAHAGEAATAARLARSRGLDWRPWALQTALVGFPSLLALRSLEGCQSV